LEVPGGILVMVERRGSQMGELFLKIGPPIKKKKVLKYSALECPSLA